MKKLVWFILFVFIGITVYAGEYQEPMTLYKDNYFVAGGKDDQVKFQVSAKYALLYPSNVGLYAAYTQVSKWDLYKKSSPFYDNNYMPELILLAESKNNIFDKDFGAIDYVQISPIMHLSNGRDEEDSRSMNMYYLECQASTGGHYNIGTNFRFFNYYSKARENRDIAEYKSYYIGDIFFKIKSKTVVSLDKEELHFKFGGYDYSDIKKKRAVGWFAIEVQFRIITSTIQPKLFLAYYKGYNEFLLDYNKKTESFRCGLSF